MYSNIGLQYSVEYSLHLVAICSVRIHTHPGKTFQFLTIAPGDRVKEERGKRIQIHPRAHTHALKNTETCTYACGDNAPMDACYSVVVYTSL